MISVGTHLSGMGEKRHKRDRGWWIPWSFVAFFLVVLAANGTMIAIAFSTWTGIETHSAYDKGLDYNRVLETARRQEALGWQIALDFAPAGERRGELALELRTRDGHPIERAEVTVNLVRPTHEGHDFEAGLDYAGGGRYAAGLAFPLPGIWDAQLRVRLRDDVYQMSERIVVR